MYCIFKRKHSHLAQSCVFSQQQGNANGLNTGLPHVPCASQMKTELKEISLSLRLKTKFKK
jgi:hypothetical protein